MQLQVSSQRHANQRVVFYTIDYSKYWYLLASGCIVLRVNCMGFLSSANKGY